MKNLGFKHMRPLAWLDETTVIWINRWEGQKPEVVGPFRLTITNVETGDIEVIEIKDSVCAPPLVATPVARIRPAKMLLTGRPSTGRRREEKYCSVVRVLGKSVRVI